MTSTDLRARLSAGEAEELLSDPTLRGDLFALDAFPAGCTDPALGHQVLCELDLLALDAGSPGLEPHLAECAACAAEQADAKESLDDLEGPATPVQVGLRCVYCHDDLDVALATYCAGCLATHHADCFSEHGSCAAPGCGEVRWVQSSAPKPARVRVWTRPLWQAAAVVLVSGLVGAGAFFEYRSEARNAAHQAALGEALAARSARNAAKLRVRELETQVQGFIAAQQYEKARALIDLEVPMIGTAEGLEPIFNLLKLAEEDSARLELAREAIRTRDVERYGQAQHALREINRSSVGVYLDAQAYLRWIESETLLVEAQETLLEGDGFEAQALLARAVTNYRVDTRGVTNEAATLLMASLREATDLASRWRQGLKALDRAELEIREDRHEQARLDLLTVQNLLPAKSPHAARASSLLRQLKSLEDSENSRLLYNRRTEGFRLSIKRGDWRSAHDWAIQLSAEHDALSWIQESAVKADASLGLFAEAEQVFAEHRGESLPRKGESPSAHRQRRAGRLEWARDVFLFLAAWLPGANPHCSASSKRVHELRLLGFGLDSASSDSVPTPVDPRDREEAPVDPREFKPDDPREVRPDDPRKFKRER